MRKDCLYFLVLLVIASSGCIGGGGDSFEGSIQITEFSVTPAQIYEGQEVTAVLEAVNTGAKEANISLGNNGSNVMTDFCKGVLSIESFDARSSSEKEDPYNLNTGQNLKLDWVLKHGGDVPRYGRSCEIKFQMPFNYSVESFQQVQITKDETEINPNLQYKSSTGPLSVDIKTLPSRTNTYEANEENENRSVEVRFEMVNQKPEERRNKGLVDIHTDSIKINATSPLNFKANLKEDGGWTIDKGDGSCSNPGTDIPVFEGKSKTYRCDIKLPKKENVNISQISEISIEFSYKFVKDVGQKTIEVQTRG
jgi:hypothetical protein